MNINYKETLIEAAHAVGEILKKYFGQTLNLIEKSTASDFKTEADIGSESAILTNLSNIIDPNNMTISYNCGYKTDRNRVAFAINNLIISKHKRIVFNWSPSYDYCLLASGKIEAIVTDPGTEVYDYTAGKLIALEA